MIFFLKTSHSVFQSSNDGDKNTLPVIASTVQVQISKRHLECNGHLLDGLHSSHSPQSASEFSSKVSLWVKSQQASRDQTRRLDPRTRTQRLAVKCCLRTWMRPCAGLVRGGGASVPYGEPIVEMDALIGVECIRCLDPCQIQHPTGESGSKVFTREVWTEWWQTHAGKSVRKDPHHTVFTQMLKFFIIIIL